MVVSKSPLRRLVFCLCAVVIFACAVACEDKNAVHLAGAVQDVHSLVAMTADDVQSVRRGLPEGAETLAGLIQKGTFTLTSDPAATRRALLEARGRSLDLRGAKSTFFAIATPDGQIIRDDRERDRMGGQSLFAAFPGLRGALSQGYVETTGSMKEAAKRSDKDGQWVAAVPVKVGDEVKAIFATGWAWSFYARTLQNNLRTKLRLDASAKQERAPLIYVLILTQDGVFAWRETPIVDMEAVANAKPSPTETSPWSRTIEIDGRAFGLAVELAPALGEGISIAVLRS